MKVVVYVRGISKKNHELVDKILTAVGLKDWEVIDLNTISPAGDIEEHLGIAFGKTSSRLAKKYTPNVYTLPPFDKLVLCEENAEHRANAWALLRHIKQVAEAPRKMEEAKSTEKNWEHVIMTIGKKQVCIYEGEKPRLESAIDCYLSRDDCRLVLAIKEAFKAEMIMLEK